MSSPFPSRAARFVGALALAGWAAACGAPPAPPDSGTAAPAPAATVAVVERTAPPDAPAPKRDVLRVCADPNNLPFSNRAGEGFENRIAELVAQDIGARVEYKWWAQRRGFIRNTLKACDCDVVIGLPTGFDMALTTRPYYRSSYVFVTRADRQLALDSLDDPALRSLKIGVEMIGDDFANTPPADALARRGVVDNVRGYTVYGDYKTANPPARIVDAVAKGDVDVALVWGPLAGYFARREPVALDVRPVAPQIDLPFLPMTYQISMGVRHGEKPFCDQLSAIIERRQADIDRILDAYGVPRVPEPGGSAAVATTPQPAATQACSAGGGR